MSLRVYCFCTYLTDIGGGWRGQDYDAHDFIHALKGRQLNGYAQIPVSGKSKRLDNTNLDKAIDWFGVMVADYLGAASTPIHREKEGNPSQLVPVPNSDSVVNAGSPRTACLARAIVKRLTSASQIADVLRFKSKMPSANQQGGTRDPEELYERLVVTGDISESPYVLVDDVFTSGGHLKACAARLRHAGAKVSMAFCAGRASSEQPDDPFAVQVEVLDDFIPNL